MDRTRWTGIVFQILKNVDDKTFEDIVYSVVEKVNTKNNDVLLCCETNQPCSDVTGCYCDNCYRYRDNTVAVM